MISLNLSYFPNWYSMFLFPKYIKFLDFHLGSVFFRTNLCDMYSQFAWRMRPRNLIPQATGTEGTWGWLKGLQLVDDDLVGGLEHDLYNFPYIGNSNPNWLSYFSEGFKPPTSDYRITMIKVGLDLIELKIPLWNHFWDDISKWMDSDDWNKIIHCWVHIMII